MSKIKLENGNGISIQIESPEDVTWGEILKQVRLCLIGLGYGLDDTYISAITKKNNEILELYE